jgi:uncharacterized protein (DUF58 family)
MLHAAARNTATVPIEAIPKRRGLHEMHRYQVSTSFPFGFIKRAVERRQKDNVLIYPALAKVDAKLMQLCRSSDTSGAHMRPRRGGQDEFYGVKEHRTGENPRWIYWRRSARPGVLVAKEMTQVAPPRLLLVVDTFFEPLQRALKAHADVERAIAMAASVASQALEEGMSVGLFAWSGEWVTLAPARGKRHRRDVLAALARLSLNTTQNTQTLLDASRNATESGVTPVLLTPRDFTVALGDRSGLVVVSSTADAGRRYFRFPEAVDFTRCMPADQEPRMEGRMKRKAEG